MASHQPIPYATMIAGFPPNIPPMVGKPTVQEMMHVYKHFILCAQLFYKQWNIMKFLSVCVPTEGYAFFSQHPHPQLPSVAGPNPIYLEADDASVRATKKSRWERLHVF